MTELIDQEHEKTKFEKAQQLFLDALDVVPPSGRQAWVLHQSNASNDVVEIVLAMLRADAAIEDRLQDFGNNETIPLPMATPSGSAVNWVARTFPQINNYEILSEIARGGMGVVYKAKQLRPNRLVAIKMIRAGSFASRSEIERFFTEADAAAQLDDESVVPVYEFGEVNGEPFIAMKYIDGDNLEAILSRDVVSIPKSLNLLVAISRAIAVAHDRGIIHRDIKPSNILVDRVSGRPWITDFGLAKYVEKESGATAAGDILGTPGYMAPEQAIGDANSATPASDVYGLGAILYRMLTGRPPILPDSSNIAAVIQLIREHDVASPRSIHRWIPRPLNTICMKCLESEPGRRYSTARDLANDLQRYLDGEAIQAKPLGLHRRFHRWSMHRPGLAVTWYGIAIFYAYHLACRGFGWVSDPTFNFAATLIAATMAISAWVWQSQLIRTSGAGWVLYAWLSSDVFLLTILLFWADSANSPLILVYHVMVAGSVLRCRSHLVAYTTCIAMSGYFTHCVYLQIAYAKASPKITTVIPTLLSLLIIGIIQYYSVRRSAVSFESQGARSSIAK